MKSYWYQAVSFGLTVALLLIFLYLVRGILAPFIIAFIIAWVFDPFISFLQRKGTPRLAAVAETYLAFLGICILAGMYLVPMVAAQAADLASDFPGYLHSLNVFGAQLLESNYSLLERLHAPTTLNEALARYGNSLSSAVQTGLTFISQFILANIGKLIWLILIPLIGFYLLNDMERIRRRLPLFIPEIWRKPTVSTVAKMGSIFNAYVRGLLIVCLLYGIATGVVLSIFHVKYAVILGIMAGILSAVPYLGSLVTTLVVFLVSLASFDASAGHAALVTAVTLGVNQAFDNIVTPRILGKSVGLNPVISLFALMAGGQLFGLVGMLVSVPVAACVQEIILGFRPELRDPPPEKKARKPRSKK